jgi:glycosyltransferase involved in cell wall biosynthesis
MKVIFIPDNSSGNPYQSSLADSLAKEGVSVRLGTATRFLRTLGAGMKRGNPDILHLHWAHPYILANTRVTTLIKSVVFILQLLVVRIRGVKIVWTIHNITNHEGRFVSLELFFCRIIARLCNKIIAHSPSAKSEVMNAYRISVDSLVTVVTHGSYISNYPNTVTRGEARTQLELDIGDTVFLCFGRIRSYRGVPELIEAFEKLAAPRAKLLIVGSPHSSEIAEDILKRCERNDNIKTVLQFVPDHEIQIYMNASDIVVLPYKDILTSGAVVLAMSFAKPIIAPAIGCIPDFLDGRGSLLYGPSNENGLLSAMRLGMQADIISMGKHNLQLARQLNWDDIAYRTFRIYKECLGK